MGVTCLKFDLNHNHNIVRNKQSGLMAGKTGTINSSGGKIPLAYVLYMVYTEPVLIELFLHSLNSYSPRV